MDDTKMFERAVRWETNLPWEPAAVVHQESVSSRQGGVAPLDPISPKLGDGYRHPCEEAEGRDDIRTSLKCCMRATEGEEVVCIRCVTDREGEAPRVLGVEGRVLEGRQFKGSK
jgi:hypothetical protein